MRKKIKIHRFTCGADMQNRLSRVDLYSPSQELYAFKYNWQGAIATYHIPRNEAIKLARKAKEYGDFWSAFLGPAGLVYNDPRDKKSSPKPGYSNRDFCNNNYKRDWINTKDVLLFYGRRDGGI